MAVKCNKRGEGQPCRKWRLQGLQLFFLQFLYVQSSVLTPFDSGHPNLKLTDAKDRPDGYPR
jgi:hypothetical protein